MFHINFLKFFFVNPQFYSELVFLLRVFQDCQHFWTTRCKNQVTMVYCTLYKDLFFIYIRILYHLHTIVYKSVSPDTTIHYGLHNSSTVIYIYIYAYIFFFVFTIVSANLFPNPYRNLTKIYGQNSQKLLDRILKCVYIFIEKTSLYQNISLLLIFIE